ncbi:MAG: diguanylate cyclase [Agathobacter sp.]|nr:diguanylate cyclase [Agathobacter sp.]
MRKSIQNKILILILVGILFSSLTIGSLGMYSFGEELEKSVISTMNLTCQEKAEELNSILGRIEQSTQVMSVLSVNHLDSMEDLKDDKYRTDYVQHLCNAAYDIAMNTEGAIGIYLRLNPEIAGPTEGFYWLSNDETKNLEIEPNTDILMYSADDVEHVGWYYEPVEAGKAIWMDPYENQNIYRNIVSYTMPIYKEEQLIGIVGMDIDWSYITDIVDEITLYETGYAFLADEDFHIAYSKEFEPGTNVAGFSEEFDDINKSELVSNDRVYNLNFNGREKTVAFTCLSNGKIMAVIAPREEINAGFQALLFRILVIVLITGTIFVFITMQIAKTIIRPLKELDKAAQDIAQGHLDVELHITSDDEVGTLAESFRETARQLKIKINYINNLAFSDKLTGIKNNTAYLQEVAYIKNDILQNKANFALFVIDANGLKFINDNYGHELGNELIIKVTQMIAEVFGSEHVYRIGGDEFAVILYNGTDAECETYEKQFEEILMNQKGKIWASASIGHAVFNEKMDSNFESVFNRADEDMYGNKIRMKSEGKTSKVVEA